METSCFAGHRVSTFSLFRHASESNKTQRRFTIDYPWLPIIYLLEPWLQFWMVGIVSFHLIFLSSLVLLHVNILLPKALQKSGSQESEWFRIKWSNMVQYGSKSYKKSPKKLLFCLQFCPLYFPLNFKTLDDFSFFFLFRIYLSVCLDNFVP